MVEIEEVDEAAEAAEEVVLSAEDQARAKAEARRKRILEGSKRRIGLVTGEVPKPAATATGTDDAVEGDDEAAADHADGNGETEKTEEAVDEPAAPSGSARLAAMRRRRFKKKQEAKKAEEAAPSSGEGGEKKEDIVEEVKKEMPPTEEPEPQPIPPASNDAKGTRKYKGVARMRRKMVKEKHAKEEASASSQSTTDVQKIPKKLKTKKLPIYLHLLTIGLLFFAGLDIGLEQPVSIEVSIESSMLGPQQHGVGLYKFAMSQMQEDDASSSRELLESSVNDWQGDEPDSSDEFQSEEDVEEKVPNIDPLFGIDLDELTHKDDTIFFMLARFAVACHRMNLFLFYYLPKRIFRNIIDLPSKLIATPPVLCLLALVIRQFSVLALGAGLPPPETDTPREDVLQMMKAGVVNFLQSNIPTLLHAYEAWSHLRLDMYVMLCGVFVGLAYRHSFMESAVESEPVGTDEL
eukprot:CAMPEP_0194051312 /NCGR_PEP_ID=MMETSP0009_2-20130614/39755_1 /TAXON_ID=210454 /ORGANISM="Grammatophora oceanica, Strain CCMP 410" /LENGTH=463 /DNA_ID=CAMNT_0038698347 /DNA_START=15 /DNA_END=1406 /DNA_ORIENTATION=-